MKSKLKYGLILAGALAVLAGDIAAAAAEGVLTIGRREDGTTMDPIKSAQNVDFWVFSNMYDVLVRVDKTGTKLEPGLAESWTVSDDQMTYTFKLRDAKFSDGTPITAGDAAWNLLRIRDHPESLWRDTYSVINDAAATDDKTLVVTLKQPTAPFLSTLAMPGISILSRKAVEADEAGVSDHPVSSGAFVMKEWRRGDKVVLERNPNFWEAARVQLDGVEWISVPDDNTRVLKLQAGELDCGIFIPFSRIAELKQDPKLNVLLDPSTREDHLLINHEHPPLDKKEVRQALDMAIDEQSIVDTVTFGVGTVANSYIPAGALYYYADNLKRPYDPAKAKEMLEAAGAAGMTLQYNVEAGNEVDEQIAVLIQQQAAQAGININIVKIDPAAGWDELVAGNYDISVNYWTNDIIDPDQKTTFVLGHDANMNYMTRYKNDAVKDLVAKARVEFDPVKREQMYVDLQKMAKEDVNWIDLYYSPYRNACGKHVDAFYQNPLGRFFLEDTKKM